MIEERRQKKVKILKKKKKFEPKLEDTLLSPKYIHREKL